MARHIDRGGWLDHTKADESLLPHIATLAALTNAELLLVHVADGWAARNYDRLKLVESEEMREDRAYLERTALEMRERHGLTVSSVLALGDPPREILRLSEESRCDLIAMTTHGHGGLGRLVLGSVADEVVRHAPCPVLLIRIREGD